VSTKTVSNCGTGPLAYTSGALIPAKWSTSNGTTRTVTCGSSACSRTCSEPAELLASELLTNAISHTTGPAALKLRRSGPSFRLGTWDTDPTPPTDAHPPHEPNDLHTEGHGLHLVRAYADNWGWFQVNPGDGHASGKYVWCELPAGRNK